MLEAVDGELYFSASAQVFRSYRNVLKLKIADLISNIIFSVSLSSLCFLSVTGCQ